MALYQPHEAVTSHPAFKSYPALRIITGYTPEYMAHTLLWWSKGRNSESFNVIIAAIKWDLQTHYGIHPSRLP